MTETAASYPGALTSIFVGGARGIVATTACYPIDLIKTLKQSEFPLERSDRIARHIFSTSGFRGFYQGFSWQLASTLVKQLWRWPIITCMPIQLEQRYGMNSVAQEIFTGLSISTLDGFGLNPLMKLRVLTGTNRPSFSFHELLREGWQGSISNWARTSVQWTVFLASQKWLRSYHEGLEKKTPLTPLQLLQVGLETSAMVTLASGPLDAATTLQYTHRMPLRTFFRTASLANMYRGSSLNFFSIAIHTTASVTGIEWWERRFRSPAS